jgi:Cu/Ag efflux pump CusA
MVEKHAIARRQYHGHPPTTINDVSVSLFGLVPILWSTGTGADVMIPLLFRLLEQSPVIYVLLVTLLFLK